MRGSFYTVQSSLVRFSWLTLIDAPVDSAPGHVCSTVYQYQIVYSLLYDCWSHEPIVAPLHCLLLHRRTSSRDGPRRTASGPSGVCPKWSKWALIAISEPFCCCSRQLKTTGGQWPVHGQQIWRHVSMGKLSTRQHCIKPDYCVPVDVGNCHAIMRSGRYESSRPKSRTNNNVFVSTDEIWCIVERPKL